jgi:hypothetical protein
METADEEETQPRPTGEPVVEIEFFVPFVSFVAIVTPV